MKLCLEAMELDPLGVVGQEVVEVSEEEEEAVAGWEVTALEPDRLVTVSALIAELD